MGIIRAFDDLVTRSDAASRSRLAPLPPTEPNDRFRAEPCHEFEIPTLRGAGIKESDTGLAHPGMWDLAADKQMMHEEQPLQVARCTKIIANGESEDDSMYMINVKQIAKFVVGLGEKVAPADIEEVRGSRGWSGRSTT